MQEIHTNNISAFEKLVTDARRICITSHMKPDGDAIGSTVALYHYLAMCGKDYVKLVLNDSQPGYLDFLLEGMPPQDFVVYSRRPVEALTCISDSDLVICLDFNAFHRADKLENALTESKADKVLIDHHLNPSRESFELVFSETDVSSASELLYHILMETKAIAHDATLLPPMTATALMTGMTTDTNNFANSVYPSTFRMASSLLAAGVDRDTILSNLYNKYEENRLRVLGHMLKDLLTITEDGVAYIILDKRTMDEYNVAEGDTEGFVNLPLSIDHVRMSLLLKEDPERVRVSIRSKKGTSANRCAKLYFNGGGHENAAGGKLMIASDIPDIKAAREYIETYTHKFLTEDEKVQNSGTSADADTHS